MPKEILTGSLDEQCEFLYNLAHEKIGQGNFTGAVHLFDEIIKHQPDYKDVAHLIREVKRRKSEQRILIFSAFGVAIVFVGIGSAMHLSNDIWLLVLAFVGLLVGYGAANVLGSFRRQ